MGAPTAKKKAAPKKAVVPTADLSSVDIDALADSLNDSGPIGPDGEIRPVEIGKRGRTGSEMEHVFSIDGTDYFVPKMPNRLLLVGYLRALRKAGNNLQAQDAATLDLLVKMIGPAGVEALETSPETTDEDVAAVMTIVTKIAFGALAAFTKAGGLAAGNS